MQDTLLSRLDAAITLLVGLIDADTPTEINPAHFCTAHNVPAELFDALRNVDCLTQDHTKRSETGSKWFVRERCLTTITAKEVESAIKVVRRKNEKVGIDWYSKKEATQLVAPVAKPSTDPKKPSQPTSVETPMLDKALDQAEEMPVTLTPKTEVKPLSDDAEESVQASVGQPIEMGLIIRDHQSELTFTSPVRPFPFTPDEVPDLTRTVDYVVSTILTQTGDDADKQIALLELVASGLRAKQMEQANDLLNQAMDLEQQLQEARRKRQALCAVLNQATHA